MTLAPLLLSLLLLPACGEPHAPDNGTPAAATDPATGTGTATDAPTANQEAPADAGDGAAGSAAPAAPADPAARANAADDGDPAGTPSTLPPPNADALLMDRGLVCGTWYADGELGYDEQWVDEAALREVFTKDRVRRREWRGFSTGDDTVPMDTLTDDREGDVVAYAYTVVERNRPDQTWPAQDAVLHVSYRSRIQVRYDGELVVDAPTPPDGQLAVQRVPVTLTDAFDTILVKLGRGPTLGGTLDFTLHLSAPDGGAVEHTRFWPMRIPGLPRDIPLREN